MYKIFLFFTIFVSFPAYSIVPMIPSAPLASDGVFENKVNTTWVNVADTSDYELYRCETTDTSSCDVAVYSGANSYYDDFDAGIDTYYYRVKACSTDGCSDYSDYDVGYRSSLPIPPIPWGVDAWFDNGNAFEGLEKVRINWQPVDYAEIYEVYRCVSESPESCSSPIYSGSGEITASDPNSRIFDDYEVPPGVTYYYRVKACNDWGCSDYSDNTIYSKGRKATTIIPLVPDAPTASIDEYADKVVITLTAVPGENTYNVYRCSEGCTKIGMGSVEFIGLGGETIAGSDPWPNYNSTLPVPGVTYSYHVQACNYAGCSTNSDSVSGRVAGIPNLSTLEASRDSEIDKVILDWTDVIGASRYELYRCNEISTTSCGSFIYSGSDTLYNDTTATPGTLYFYRAKSCSVAGCSELSARANGRIAVPLDVSSKTFFASDGSYADRVELSGLIFDGALTYDLYRCLDASIGSCGSIIHSGDAGILGPDNNYFDISSEPASLVVMPAPGVIYYYRAKWCNAAGCSDYNPYSEGSRAALILPATPSGVDASDSTFTDKITVTWPAVLLATDYTLFRCLDATIDSCNALYSDGDTFYDDTEATPGVIYRYSVVACNSAGCSDYSYFNEGSRKVPGLVPTASDGVYQDKVIVSWESVSYATRYLLMVCRIPSSRDCITTVVIRDGSTSYTDTSFTQQGAHYYSVRVCNFGSCSDEPSFDDFTLGSLATVAVPAATVASDDTYADKVIIDWSTVDYATHYYLYRYDDSNLTTGSFLGSVGATTYEDTSVVAGVTYYYTLKACSLAGCSDSSDSDSGRRSILDTDGDGIPDDCDQACIDAGMVADPDDDNDGVIDEEDAYPLISLDGRLDTDGDGAPDECDQTCIDAGMGADLDDDNDGLNDSDDAYPLAAIGALTDTDNDGAPDECDQTCIDAGMSMDPDDDNDGVLDPADAYSLISLDGRLDTDGDGRPDDCDQVCIDTGMAADPDDDNDGIADASDVFPSDPAEHADTDGDGLGDNREAAIGTDPTNPDTDSDGYTDLEEVEAGSNPLDSDDEPVMRGLNIILIKAAMDAKKP